MNRYTFAILTNGREVENLDPGIFATEAEARAAAEDALELCCPAGSPQRRYYRAEIRPAEDDTAQAMSVSGGSAVVVGATQTAKHTPGPWTLGPDIRSKGDLVYRQVLSGPKRLCAASVYGAKGKGLDPTFTEDEVQANARLIAAAPELLAACETLVAIEDAGTVGRCGYCGLHPTKCAAGCPVNLARKAIAKAKGQA